MADQDPEVAHTHVSAMAGAGSNPLIRADAPSATPSPVLWGAALSPPDFTNSTKDDVVNAYMVLLGQYNDLNSRYATILTLGQNKDWGFVNDERKNQLEAALMQIGALLVQADPTRAVQVAGQIVGLVNQVMPGVLPSTIGTPLWSS